MSKRHLKAEPLDRMIVESFAVERDMDDATVEQVLWLSRILSELSQNRERKDFALMGGSAIVFLHKNMYRFSTDLDLDFIGNKSLGVEGIRQIRERMEKDRSLLRKIAEQLDMSFALAKDVGTIEAAAKRRFIQYEFTFPSIFRRTGMTVEVDLSYRYCHSVLGTELKPWPITIDGILPPFQVQTLRPEELYAGKIIAMLGGERTERMDFPGKIGLFFKRKIRHLYDIYLLADEINNDPKVIDLAVLKRLVLLFGMSRIKDFPFFRGDGIVAYDEDDKRDELTPVVSREMPLPTVQEMKWVVRQFLDEHLFRYEQNDYDFMEDFSAKLFRPQKIFGEKEARRLKTMFYYKEMLDKVAPLQGGHKPNGNQRKRGQK